jgi:hypothetical protein
VDREQIFERFKFLKKALIVIGLILVHDSSDPNQPSFLTAAALKAFYYCCRHHHQLEDKLNG